MLIIIYEDLIVIFICMLSIISKIAFRGQTRIVQFVKTILLLNVYKFNLTIDVQNKLIQFVPLNDSISIYFQIKLF